MDTRDSRRTSLDQPKVQIADEFESLLGDDKELIYDIIKGVFEIMREGDPATLSRYKIYEGVKLYLAREGEQPVELAYSTFNAILEMFSAKGLWLFN